MEQMHNHTIKPLKRRSQVGPSCVQEGICAILQGINLPAVRVEPITAEVLEYNELFSSLVHPFCSPNCRLWFVEGVLPNLAPTDRTCLEGASAGEISVRLPIAFTAADGRTANYELHSVPSPGHRKNVQSIVCIFIPETGPWFLSGRDKLIAEGRESERTRIRNALHKNISQQLLGAAFGFKVLATKIARLNDGLGKEASELVVTLNQAVVELQNLMRSDSNEK